MRRDVFVPGRETSGERNADLSIAGRTELLKSSSERQELMKPLRAALTCFGIGVLDAKTEEV